jgi:hypothetical protein
MIKEYFSKIIRIMNNSRFIKVVLIMIKYQAKKIIKNKKNPTRLNAIVIIKTLQDLNKIHLILCRLRLVHNQNLIIINSIISFDNNLISVSKIF